HKRKIGFLGLRTGEIQVVKDVNFYLEKGQTIGIVGESGSGKTTLAKAIIRLLNSSGKIKFKEHYISKLSEAKFKPYRKKIQIVFQDPYSSLNPRMTVEEIILEGLKAHKIKADYDQLIDETLTSMNLKPEMKYRYPHQMSGGEKQRVGIARSLVLKPDLIVMDEPTSALDLLTQGEILDILKTLQREKHISFLFISHDLRVIKSISHYIIVMKDGVIVEQGDTKQIFESPKTDYTKKLIESAFLKGL
ncbi:MAG TPA: microcin ABC transporter ATP-binding protein, partial [Alphaproteobacteria bacterium]|nr:microcin ABC transporter ATP-binding protein [Alphaproteobacteria bacterium]